MAETRQDPRDKVRELRAGHPECQIQLITTQLWESVSHPGPGKTVVHVAETIDELRAKIEADG
jgi:hypothetical protein